MPASAEPQASAPCALASARAPKPAMAMCNSSITVIPIPDGSQATVASPDESAEFFENPGIRKGVLLSRYADLLKNWMIDEREHIDFSRPWVPNVNDDDGIVVPPSLGQWERQSLPLAVSGPYRELFEEFRGYFEAEVDALGDETLNQELGILNTLGGPAAD